MRSSAAMRARPRSPRRSSCRSTRSIRSARRADADLARAPARHGGRLRVRRDARRPRPGLPEDVAATTIRVETLGKVLRTLSYRERRVSSCATGSTDRRRGRSTRSGGRSASRGSASVRSRPRACASCRPSRRPRRSATSPDPSKRGPLHYALAP